MAARPFDMTPVSFLQSFTTRALHLAQRLTPSHAAPACIESLGLAASSELEENYRRESGVDGPFDADPYADCIVGIKNAIGGDFTRAPAEPGTVRVVARQCPFGDAVKQAPELCRTTASVFGAIAARNFGDARVQLRKRIATGDGMCEICIHLNPASHPDAPGDAYHSDDGVLVECPPVGSTENGAPSPDTTLQAWAREHGLVADSEPMRRALRAVQTVAPTNASVLIEGETGVGKEVLARALHGMSKRAGRPFVAVNCGAIPETLIESYLFGHERGAFTGAHAVHQGVFERADNSTLFLDELDCLPLHAQARLLRVLQNGEFERVGGHRPQCVDVRVVSALNGDIRALVEQGRFRRDLYYRLNVVPISIPPLRQRPEDILALATQILAGLAVEHRAPSKVLGEHAWLQLLGHSWPGNVRELENVLERAFLFARGRIIRELDVPPSAAEAPRTVDLAAMKKQAAAEVERRILHRVMSQCSGNVTAAARLVKVSPRAMHQKLHRHGMSAARYRQGNRTARQR